MVDCIMMFCSLVVLLCCYIAIDKHKREMKELSTLELVVFVLFVVLIVGVLLYVLKDIVETYLWTYDEEEENRDEGQ